jgi:hypothetical protein
VNRELTQAKRIVLAKWPKAYISTFDGLHLLSGNGYELISVMDDTHPKDDLWIEAAKIMAVSGD